MAETTEKGVLAYNDGDTLTLTDDGIEVYEATDETVLGTVPTEDIIQFGTELEELFDDDHERERMKGPKWTDEGLSVGQHPILGTLGFGRVNVDGEKDGDVPPATFEPDEIIEAAKEADEQTE